MECQQNGCEAEAVAIAHAATGDTSQCEDHCKQIHGLYTLLGHRIVFTSLETGQTMAFK